MPFPQDAIVESEGLTWDPGANWVGEHLNNQIIYHVPFELHPCKEYNIYIYILVVYIYIHIYIT